MYFVDSQRTLTRRDSSLVTPRKLAGTIDNDLFYNNAAPSTNCLSSISDVTISLRPRGSVQKELVSQFYESMLGTIIESWNVIEEPKKDININENAETFLKDRKRKKPNSGGGISDRSKFKTIQSRPDLNEAQPIEQNASRAPTEERAIVKFKNGNVYEGSFFMKCLNGLGRFQWADGTVYLGQFKDNAMNGKGKIEYSDECWYEGDFLNNMRHGYGIYVDPHFQQCYIGEWHCGKQHGKGVIYYDRTFTNSYDGEWEYNVRHGYGVREYSRLSGYKGYWNRGVKHGDGMMIWENHDVYRGKWDNGVMANIGEYTWGTFYNNTLTLPSLNVYRGHWKNGERHGHGKLYLGFEGAMYVGEFSNNKKHGPGKLVTNNGLILQDRELYNNDNFAIMEKTAGKFTGITEPLSFPFCDYTFGLLYHVEQTLHDMLNLNEARAIIVLNFVRSNDIRIKPDVGMINRCKISQLIESEIECLKKALLCYQKDLLDIYNTYANICNNKEINFNPVLIRLFLWQLYYDCDIINYDLTLVEIDKMLSKNPEWWCKRVHDPFEKIYFWQFLHSLITVATKLYLPKNLPGDRPDSIVGKAFRTFVEKDLLPNKNKRKGNLVNGYGNAMPLKAMYNLYRQLGEPLTVRTFLRAIRYPAHCGLEQPPLVEGDTPPSRTVYLIGDELNYIQNESSVMMKEDRDCTREEYDLKLFNFGNLTIKHIVKHIFKKIFPKICIGNKIVNVDLKMTFYEFFEAFILCAEESIKQEEILKEAVLNELMVNNNSPVTPERPNKVK